MFIKNEGKDNNENEIKSNINPGRNDKKESESSFGGKRQNDGLSYLKKNKNKEKWEILGLSNWYYLFKNKYIILCKICIYFR